MQLSLDETKRFHQVVFPLLNLFNLSQRELMEIASIDRRRRSTLARACKDERGRLTVAEAKRVVERLTSLVQLPCDADDVWKFITEPSNTVHPGIREIMLTGAVQPSEHSLKKMEAILADLESKCEFSICRSDIMKLSALPRSAVEIIHRNVTRNLGHIGEGMRLALNASYRRRRADRVKGIQGPKRQTHILLASDIRDFLAGKGLAEGLSPDDRSDTLEDYVEDAIELRDDEVGVVDDSILPAHLLRHFRQFAGTFVVGTSYVMKVVHGGLRRITCVGKDTARIDLIRNELEMLLALKRYVSHSWNKAAMKDALYQFLPDARLGMSC